MIPIQGGPGVSPASTSGGEPLRKVARELQGVFFNEMLKAMRATLPQDGLFSGGAGGDTFTGMLDERLAQVMSQSSRTSLEEAIFRQLSARQPSSDPSSDSFLPDE